MLQHAPDNHQSRQETPQPTTTPPNTLQLHFATIASSILERSDPPPNHHQLRQKTLPPLSTPSNTLQPHFRLLRHQSRNIQSTPKHQISRQENSPPTLTSLSTLPDHSTADDAMSVVPRCSNHFQTTTDEGWRILHLFMYHFRPPNHTFSYCVINPRMIQQLLNYQISKLKNLLPLPTLFPTFKLHPATDDATIA